MEERIKKIMSALFNVPMKTIGNDSSPKTVPGWDSMAHMNLILALEEEFRVEFDDQEIPELMDFRAIVQCLMTKESRTRGREEVEL